MNRIWRQFVLIALFPATLFAQMSTLRGQVTDEMKTIILLGRFVPATSFGVRTSGTIQVRQSLPPCKEMPCSATVRG